MWRWWMFSTVLKLWMAVSISLCQSGDDALADLGSGYIIDTLHDQPTEPKSQPRSHPQDTTHCQLTFTVPPQDRYVMKETPSVVKEEATHLQNLLQDTNRVLQSLQYTVNADAQDLGYQEVIAEHNKGIREDNKEFYGTLSKIMQEFHTHMEDDAADVPDERKMLKRNFQMMDNLLHTTTLIAEKLDRKAGDLDAAFEKQMARCTTLAYQTTMGS
ncbi:uncharacterized protein LOC108718307 [Xenopus laevis]|uniref:Uncharacterized protein LOC108718307 n=2 Tax=Xenopus laevis TaxID=8355 RepID=A0A1L8G5H5_XENLA|nr:uncharacterized protein LOC108718307 [Xenopus laevis]OCT79137.1 hypothetical protein XELAEV_18030235mg [Xenopus laevis]